MFIPKLKDLNTMESVTNLKFLFFSRTNSFTSLHFTPIWRWPKDNPEAVKIQYIQQQLSLQSTMLSAAGLGYVGGQSTVTNATPPYSPPPTARHSPLPSFGFTQEQVACVCEVRNQDQDDISTMVDNVLFRLFYIAERNFLDFFKRYMTQNFAFRYTLNCIFKF